MVALSAAHSSTAAPPRFFFAGNGRLVLRHAYFDTTLDVRYRHADGTYDPAVLRQINHFFRSREDGHEAPISLRLIELLAYIQDRYHPRHMILLSGFRSPEFNADLRSEGRAVAQASLHTQALAADILFQGLDMARLWRQLRGLRVGGVGYYRKNNFLHIDTGPPRFWEATTSRVDENLSAGNARIFLRTDFDRYAGIEGALVSVHSVTAFPLLIASPARVVGPNGSASVAIQPISDAVEQRDGCFAITTPADAYQFRVASAAPSSRVRAPSSWSHAPFDWAQGRLRDAAKKTAAPQGERLGSFFGSTVSAHPEEAHAFGAVSKGPDSRSHVVLSTCEPRIEKTPGDIESNAIEVTAP